MKTENYQVHNTENTSLKMTYNLMKVEHVTLLAGVLTWNGVKRNEVGNSATKCFPCYIIAQRLLGLMSYKCNVSFNGEVGRSQ